MSKQGKTGGVILFGLAAVSVLVSAMTNTIPKINRIRFFPVSPTGKPNFGPTFGAPRSGHPHAGIDIFAAEGTPVYAVDDGRVSYGTGVTPGLWARLDVNGGHFFYAHLSAFEGEARQVTAGELIGYVGKTGNAASTPPHLHFEWRVGGEPVDPFEYLTYVAPAGSVTKAG